MLKDEIERRRKIRSLFAFYFSLWGHTTASLVTQEKKVLFWVSSYLSNFLELENGLLSILFMQIHYTARFADGIVFDSSYKRGRALTMRLGMGKVCFSISGSDVSYCYCWCKARLCISVCFVCLSQIIKLGPLNYQIDSWKGFHISIVRYTICIKIIKNVSSWGDI